jgi:hypothetical protein
MRITALPEPDESEKSGRAQFRTYWISSALATVIFLLSVYVMMMVPGVRAADKLWMLSIAGGLLAASLGTGIWKFRTTNAPITAWPLGPVVWLFLLLQLGICVLGVFQVIAAPFR